MARDARQWGVRPRGERGAASAPASAARQPFVRDGRTGARLSSTETHAPRRDQERGRIRRVPRGVASAARLRLPRARARRRAKTFSPPLSAPRLPARASPSRAEPWRETRPPRAPPSAPRLRGAGERGPPRRPATRAPTSSRSSSSTRAARPRPRRSSPKRHPSRRRTSRPRRAGGRSGTRGAIVVVKSVWSPSRGNV